MTLARRPTSENFALRFVAQTVRQQKSPDTTNVVRADMIREKAGFPKRVSPSRALIGTCKPRLTRKPDDAPCRGAIVHKLGIVRLSGENLAGFYEGCPVMNVGLFDNGASFSE